MVELRHFTIEKNPIQFIDPEFFSKIKFSINLSQCIRSNVKFVKLASSKDLHKT